MKEKEVLVTFFMVILLTFVIFLFPMIIIWAMNNLFKLEILYNWKNWVSVYILLVVLSAACKDQKITTKEKNFYY